MQLDSCECYKLLFEISQQCCSGFCLQLKINTLQKLLSERISRNVRFNSQFYKSGVSKWKKEMTFLLSVEITDSHCCYKIFVKGVLHNGTFEWFHILTDKLQFLPFTVICLFLCVIYLYLPFFFVFQAAFLCAPMIKACQRQSFYESVSNKRSVLLCGTSDLTNP